MVRVRRSGAVAIAAAGSALLFGACGGRVINTGELEDELRRQLAPQGGVRPEEIAVSCPDDQKAEEGRRFACTLTAPNGDRVRVDVTLTDDRGGFHAVVPEQTGS
jgi:hypothetical protein